MNNEILNNTLVTGSNGAVSSYVDIGIKAERKDFDITNLEEVNRFIIVQKPRVILHLAALTDLAKCETDPSHAYMANAVGTYNLAIAARSIGAKLVYVSTDAVFQNSKNPHLVDDERGPGSIYGHSKYLGELAVQGNTNNFIIARTSWVFGGGKEKDKKFVGKFINELKKSEAKAINDEFSSPTYAKDLVQALKNLIMEDKTGFFHLANSGTASRYDMAIFMKEVLNSKTKIEAVSSREFDLLPYQKSSGGLVSNFPFRPWQEALKEYLEKELI